MSAHLSFFPVGNGDMTLVQTEGGHNLLIDMNIRSAADDPDDDTPDVASKLRDKLPRDDAGRLYVDALLVSHPDEDHCRGLRKHFHLGAPDKWSKSTDQDPDPGNLVVADGIPPRFAKTRALRRCEGVQRRGTTAGAQVPGNTVAGG